MLVRCFIIILPMVILQSVVAFVFYWSATWYTLTRRALVGGGDEIISRLSDYL